MTKDRRIFVMQCGFHAYMESWGMAVGNPYFAITQADGTFSLHDVLPGDYTLAAWHPGVGTTMEKKVTVPAKQMVRADFVFESLRDGVPPMRSRITRILGWARWINPWRSDRLWNCRSRKASSVKGTTMKNVDQRLHGVALACS